MIVFGTSNAYGGANYYSKANAAASLKESFGDILRKAADPDESGEKLCKAETDETGKTVEKSCYNCLDRDKCPGFNGENKDNDLSADSVYFPAEGADIDKIAATLSEVPDEQAEYFREKYGEIYDEERVSSLYDELAERKIIGIKHTSYASGYGFAIPLSGLKCRGCFTAGGRDIYGLGAYCTDTSTAFNGSKMFFKDVTRTDKYAYKYEWEAFKSGYDREINTWRDALQESIDFEKYLKMLAENSAGGKRYPSPESCDEIIAGLEKIEDVITQIFG